MAVWLEMAAAMVVARQALTVAANLGRTLSRGPAAPQSYIIDLLYQAPPEA